MTGITATDFFCGAGGSSTGLVAAGMTVKHAANHWQRAIETHSHNHPSTEHSIDDLQQAHASWYPTTDVAWFSPECTNHSTAKGRKRKGIDQMQFTGEGWGVSRAYDPAEERSRATMREVVEFTAFHKYKAVIVENVVEITLWAHYDAWLRAMTGLGYDHKVLYLNAQFFGVPQSRDRIYIVFWRKGIKAPNLDFRPPAICAACGEVNAVQALKPKSKTLAKRYGANRQYVYRCPHCYAEVRPWHVPAAAAIDWSLPVERIADRKKPLKPKTMERIAAGLKKLAARSFVMDTANSHAGHGGKVKPTTEPLPTQTSRASQAVVSPMLMNQATAPRTVDEPMNTVAGSHTPGLVVSLNHSSERSRSLEEPFATIMPHVRPWLLTMRQSMQARDVDDALSTVSAGGNNHALIYNYRRGEPFSPIDDAIKTVTAHAEQHALVNPPYSVEECGFRMLEPHELKLAMGFPQDYTILGNKREQVKQVGNAVCCPVAYMIAVRVVEALEKSA